jgi:hypothetical protein
MDNVCSKLGSFTKSGCRRRSSAAHPFQYIFTVFANGGGTTMMNVFLIGYGVVAGFNVGDEKPPHY